MKYKAKEIWFFEPVESTPQIRKSMETFYSEWLNKHSSDESLILYHYTNLDGLKGILNTRSIWLTNTSTLNDPTELTYGKDIILNSLNDKFVEETEPLIKDLLSDIIAHVMTYESISFKTYVACFCEENNLLSQWRAYGHYGGGYNLGFKFNSNTEFYHRLDDSRNKSYVILRKIIYNPIEQHKFVSDYLSSIISSAKEAIVQNDNGRNLPSYWASMASMEAVNILIDLLLSFKNPVFSEEKEWRLIFARQASHKSEQLEFREADNNLIPYIDTEVVENINGNPSFPINSIQFGPTLDESSTRTALELYVNKVSTYNNRILIHPENININGAGYTLRQ